MPPPARQIKENVGNLVATIDIPQTINSIETVHPQNLEQVSSYNWLGSRPTPTIMVPGSPNL